MDQVTAERLENHASYLKNWLKQMEDDPKFVFKAASQGAKAADFVLSFSGSRVVPARELARVLPWPFSIYFAALAATVGPPRS